MAADSLVSTPECLGVGVGDTLDQLFVLLTTLGLFCSVRSVPLLLATVVRFHWFIIDHIKRGFSLEIKKQLVISHLCNQ